MKDIYIDACLNPVRQRILQVLIEKKGASAAQILEVLTDIPRASLYLHIKILADAGVIEAVREVPKRGSVEKFYALAAPPADAKTNEGMNQMIQAALIALANDFSRYFSEGGNDPQKDMLTLGQATLMLSDEEFTAFLAEYSQMLAKFLHNKPSAERKTRKITFISSPADDILFLSK